jgi:hypothetical protein
MAAACGRSTQALDIMEPRAPDRSHLEPRSENLRLARLFIQIVIAAFGIVPLWLAVDLARSTQWVFATLWFGVFVAVEITALVLVPIMAGSLGLVAWGIFLTLRLRKRSKISLADREVDTPYAPPHPPLQSTVSQKAPHGRALELTLILLLGAVVLAVNLHKRMSVEGLLGLLLYFAIAAAFASFWHRIWRLGALASIVGAACTATATMAMEYVNIGGMPELALPIFAALFLVALVAAGIVQLVSQRNRAEAGFDV